MSVVTYSGLKKLDANDASQLKTLVEHYMEKIERVFPYFDLLFHTKVHKPEGRIKYSFHGRIDAPSVVLTSEASDWDLARTVHKVMRKLENEARKKYKIGGQKQERFHPKKAKRGTDVRVKLKLRRRAQLL